MLAISVFFPVVFTDWRVPFLSRLPVLNIFPLCFLLGYLTPKLIDEYACGDPEKAGKVYAINIAGCVLGPLSASYLLLPFFGSRISIIILSLPILWLFMKHWDALRSTPIWRAILSPLLAVVIFCSLFISISFEEGLKKIDGVIRHDYTATVVSYGSGFQKRLLVNGVGMTTLTPTTKDMAHMPLVFLNHKPESALVICLGMGTTLRSVASWGIDVTAVELVPSVKEAFGYYHADADRVLSQPNVRIIVDDGRRYLRRAAKKFDVIVIDPPPPLPAAGSSLLYSEEFYSLIKLRLKPDGILQQWFPGGEPAVMSAVTKSLTRSFPCVLMYRSIEGPACYHYLASMSPIRVPSATEAILRMPEAAKKDRLEWDVNSEARLMEIWRKLLKGKEDPALFTKGSNIRIIDDRPFNEYYFLRYLKKLNFKSFISWMTGHIRGDPAFVGNIFIGDNPYVDAYINRGSAYAKLGQYQRAIEDFNEAIRLKPDYADAYFNRGVVYYSIGQYQRAIEDYNEAIRIKPDDTDDYNSRGAAYANLEQYQRAIDDFNKAIRLKPDYVDAYANRCGTYFMLGNKKIGCRDAQKACELGNCKVLETAKGKGVCR
jgi:spermidine synthase/Tfp pilus assembly protein PilF